MLSSISTASLLDSFPMFGHPGISALEYAGQVEKRKKSTSLSEVSLKCKSTITTTEQNTTSAETEGGCIEGYPQVNFFDEFGVQRRRRGTFINHTPRNYEMQSSKPVEVYRPSRRESENYSRPLSRASMGSASPSIPQGFCQCGTHTPDDLERRQELDNQSGRSPGVYVPTTKSKRRSVSAPPGDIVTPVPQSDSPTDQRHGGLALRSTSILSYQPQEKKRQRRQTPFKISTAEANASRHAPLEPWVAKHQRKRTGDSIGDVPFDMDREVSAEMGAFGVIQRYFGSQDGGPVTTSTGLHRGLSSNPPDIPPPVPSLPTSEQAITEPIAIFPIDELAMPTEPPPVPDRSPKRLTAPSFPPNVTSVTSIDTEFNFASEGQYSPYHEADDELHVSKKREAAEAGSPNLGKMAPTILGHHALTANNDLGLNELSYFLRHTGPPPKPRSKVQQRKKAGMRLFKAKQRKTLAARVGSVEGSPQCARKQPPIPPCAQETVTSKGAKHLKIIIPTETPRGSQALSFGDVKSKKERRSRHVSITFTEEMLNPLASPEIERILFDLDPHQQEHQRSTSAPLPRSPLKRSPKASPIAVPVTDHPLAFSRNESVRARKLRDLQRIKRKPIPQRTAPSALHQVCDALPMTPAHTPEPEHGAGSPPSRHLNEQNDSGIDEESPVEKMCKLQDRVVHLQRQNTQLTEALAKIVGLEIGDGSLEGEEVLRACRRMRALGEES